MATTRLIPLHIGKGRTIASALVGSLDYIENPDKTNGGELIASYECGARTADAEFLLSKNQYALLTGRDQGERNVIAYHTRQSFRPGEITAEEASRIGYELAMRLTKGKHAFIVCTHTDRAHIHSHIIWNSTALDCSRKWRNFLGSTFAIRRISDRLCVEHGLSIIKNPKPSRGHYGTWLGDERVLPYQEKLRRAIDEILEQRPPDFDIFLAAMQAAGYEYKPGKNIGFRAPGQKNFTKCREATLGADYTEQAIRARIQTPRVPVNTYNNAGAPRGKKINLLMDIQSRIQDGKSPGYERWARVFNLKQAAQTLIFLQEQGLTDYAVLAEKTAAATAKHNSLLAQIKELESGLSSNADLQKHIVNYSKTRATYVAYRQAGYSKQFRAEHETDILLHQTAKRAFDALHVKKLPTVASLRAEYARLLADKKKAHRSYTAAKKEMRELLVVKANVDRLLNLPEQEREHGSGSHNL